MRSDWKPIGVSPNDFSGSGIFLIWSSGFGIFKQTRSEILDLNFAWESKVGCWIKPSWLRDCTKFRLGITGLKNPVGNPLCERHVAIRVGSGCLVGYQGGETWWLVIIYRWGGGRRILGGITWFLGEQGGESVVTENVKEGALKTLEGFRGRTTHICLENEDMGGSRKS